LRKLAKVEDALNGPVAIKFFATWCGPCKLYAPVFERTATRHPDLNFYEVDVDEAPSIREWFGVSSVPTTIILNDGEQMAYLSGATSSKRLDAALSSVLSLTDAHST
jgi:thioredoxin 1